MADPRGSGSIEPDEVGRREFTKMRRGYDPIEVKAFLNKVSSELRSLRHANFELEGRVVELEGEIRSAERPDEHRIAQVLGEETARVIEAARQAANEIRTKAEENVARLLKDAQSDASQLRQDADQLIANKKQEADEIIAKAREEGQRLRVHAEETAGRLRKESEEILAAKTTEAEERAADIRGEAEKVLEEARVAAETEIEAGRDQGREMIAEAKKLREKILRDLAKRRKVARKQLEALRAGRESLLDAFESVRAVLDDTTGDLRGALVDAREAADEASRMVSDDENTVVAELEAQLVTVEVSAAEEVEGPAEEGPELVAEEEPATAEEPVEEPEEGAGQKTQRHLRAVEDAEGEAETGEEGTGEEGSGDDVGALFARIKADREHAAEEARETLREHAEAGLDEESVLDLSEESAVIDLSEGEAGDSTETVLDRRDVLVEPIERSLGRRLKRALSDEQNQVLDSLRRHKKGIPGFDEVLDGLDEHVETYSSVAMADLDDAIRAGADFLEGDLQKVDPDEFVDGLVEAIGTSFVEPLRARLEACFSEVTEVADKEEVAERVRAVYREWKNQKVAEDSEQLVLTAFNRGLYESVPAGTRLCWVVDNGGLPCPDADDNALAGGVPKGEPYPTGDLLPPAHPGCRCLLVRDDN